MAALALVVGLILGGVLSAVVIFRGIKDDCARRRVFTSIRFTDDLAEHRRVADMLKRMYPEFEKTLFPDLAVALKKEAGESNLSIL